MTGKKYRLFKVAKELNTGSSTLVEHLAARGYDVDDTPNAKLNEEMYHILLKDFASEKVLKQKAEEIKEKKQEKRFKSEEVVEEREQEPISAEQLKSGILDARQSAARRCTGTRAYWSNRTSSTSRTAAARWAAMSVNAILSRVKLPQLSTRPEGATPGLTGYSATISA